MNGPLTVGTAVEEPGALARGEIVLGHYPDAPVTSPVLILSGALPGPTLWVQGCIHGTEVGGSLGALRALRRADPAAAGGRIVLVMHANPLAFRAASRVTPLDGENVNRVFPGDPAGPHSRQLAARLLATALGCADAMMDLHSGGLEAIVPFYALYRDDGSPAGRESARLARATGADDVWASCDAWLDGAMFTRFAAAGKPALIVECGGGGPLPEADLEHFAGAVEGVARALGILPGEAASGPPRRVLDRCEMVYGRAGGYVLPLVRAGDIVAAGATLARILDAYGDVAEEIVAPLGPAYVAAIARPYLPVHSGAMIAECAHLAGGPAVRPGSAPA